MRAPEPVERAIEDRQLIVPVHQQRATRVIHLVARSEIHVLQRVRDVDHPPDVHVDRRAQQPAEDDQVVLEARHLAGIAQDQHR